jgi:hypothetical protein
MYDERLCGLVARTPHGRLISLGDCRCDGDALGDRPTAPPETVCVTAGLRGDMKPGDACPGDIAA